jgi:FtsH-binding integral membrane protein
MERADWAVIWSLLICGVLSMGLSVIVQATIHPANSESEAMLMGVFFGLVGVCAGLIVGLKLADRHRKT